MSELLNDDLKETMHTSPSGWDLRGLNEEGTKTLRPHFVFFEKLGRTPVLHHYHVQLVRDAAALFAIVGLAGHAARGFPRLAHHACDSAACDAFCHATFARAAA